MSTLFYDRPRLLALTLILILVSGLSSLAVLPRTEDPELTGRFGNVFTAYPGVSAERVESLVTKPIEDELREIEEMKEITSVSRQGISTVVIEIGDDVARDKVDEVWSRLRDKLGDVESKLPAGALAPVFEDGKITAYTLVLGLTWSLDTPPERAILGRLGEELADRMRNLTGTEDVAIFGEPNEEILVEVDAARLAAHGLTAADVSRALARGDAKVSAGSLRGAGTELLIELSGELDSLARVEDLPVATDQDGNILRVGDLGTARKAEVEPVSAFALIGGDAGVAVAARMLSAQRIDKWAASALESVDEFATNLPRGVELSVIFDQSRYTEERLTSLFMNFAVGSLLVTMVIFLTMGWRSALMVGAALPLTTLLVLTGMRMLGVPMHQMSVTGLIIALGLLIDNAIVIVDEVRHRLSGGAKPREAVGDSVRALAIPLLGSTVTTALAFMPIVLMPGGAGEFVGTMALSVVLAIVSSLFLAMTVIPTLTGWLSERGKGPRDATSVAANGLSFPRLAKVYGRGVRLAVKRPVLGIAVALVLPILGFWGGSTLEEQFFPAADRDQFAIELYLPKTASLAETRRAAERARALVLEHPRVEEVHFFLGESAPKFYYNFLDQQRNAPHYAQAIVQLDDDKGSIEIVRELQDRLDSELPDVLVLAKQIEQGPPFDAPVEMHIYGPDLVTLRALGDEVRGVLASVPEVVHTRTTLESGHPALSLALDDDEVRLAGLDNAAVAEHLAANLDGVVGGSILEATEELPVRVRVGTEERGDMANLATLELAGANGWTSLSALGELSLEPSLAQIPHRDGSRTNTVQGFVSAGTLPSYAVEGLMARLDASGFELPIGYRMELGGEAAERDDAVGQLMATAGILMVLMAASVVLTFDSFSLAGLIALVGMLSVGLSLGALSVFGYPFGFMSIVGTLGLIGVAINDSIVVLAAIRDDPDARRGDAEAIAKVTERSTRHVVSTSLTTMVGFVPLFLQGGGFWPPVAVAIGGGVTGATLLALTLVPAGYRVLLARRQPTNEPAHAPVPVLA